jgi:hypothetical protein
MVSSRSGWERVHRSRPCPICEGTDWCLLSEDGSAVICPRVQEGSVKKVGESGYLHRLRDDAPEFQPRQKVVVKLPVVPPARMAPLARQYCEALVGGQLERFAIKLGVDGTALRRLGVGWCGRSSAWSFPMSDALGRVTGIRLRSDWSGKKFCEKGSREGLFLPADLVPSSALIITEGPTDAAAALSWGLETVGRPSCTGGMAAILALVKRLMPPQVVVVADSDKPGQDGARNLARHLAVLHRDVRIVQPPCKDVRQWRKDGAKSEDFLALVEGAKPIGIRVRVAIGRGVDRGR